MDLAHAFHHVAHHVLRRIKLRLLRQVANGEPLGETRFAGEAVIKPGHDLEQTRFTSTVASEYADLGTRIERQRDVLQHRAIGRVEASELVTGVNVLSSHVGRQATRNALQKRAWPSRLFASEMPSARSSPQLKRKGSERSCANHPKLGYSRSLPMVTATSSY